MRSTDDHQGFLFPLYNIRDEISSGEDRDVVCLRYVTELIKGVTADPEEFFVRIKTVVVPDGPRNSIPCSQIVPGCYGSHQ
ncbi:MAG: hypothetical protein P4M11_02305 [Candidatus Pacebacteria bacterium]|nr:hypothetical protein [Candidatus Paceibacterota bacterium]